MGVNISFSKCNLMLSAKKEKCKIKASVSFNKIIGVAWIQRLMDRLL